MKRILASAALASIMIFTACNKESEELSESVTESVQPESSEEISDGSSTEKTSVPSSNVGFDFDDAVRNIGLFDKTISLPCKFEEFGKDFTIGSDHFYRLSNNNLVAFVCYKGKIIGEVILENCYESERNKERKMVVELAIGDCYENPVTDPEWFNGEIDFDFFGITMNSTVDEIKSKLGEPTPKKGMSFKNRIVYEKNKDEYVDITIKNGKIVEFVINVK